MKEVLKELDNMEIKYEVVEHKPVYTIEDMNNLDPNIFKGAEICKNLFLHISAPLNMFGSKLFISSIV